MNTTKAKGFTLIEMLIAIMIITIGVLGAYSSVYKYTKNTQQERENFVAAYLGQEGIEIIKNIRDSNWVDSAAPAWDTGLTGCNNGCEADYDDLVLASWSDPGSNLYINDPNNYARYQYTHVAGDIKTPYTRRIDIVPVGTDELDITVYVYWGTSFMIVKENIYNWR